MDRITVTINGNKIAAERGKKILQVAKENGIQIPTLCNSPELKPTGACRLCVVEVHGARALVPACSAEAMDGMVIETHSDKVNQARKIVLELLWSAHPNDCTMCEKSGACDLQKYTYEYGASVDRFKSKEPYSYRVDGKNPYYVRDYNKCILCGRCVRACDEIQGNNVLDIANRGYKSMVSTPFSRPLEESNCVFCGNCIAQCPTGALTEKERYGKGREWEFKKVNTTCPYCGCGCSFDLCVKDNKIVKVDTSDPEKNLVNKSALCVKGRFGLGFVHAEDRLDYPMIRKTPKGEGTGTLKDFQKVSWKKALDYTAARLKDIKAQHGPNALGGFSSAKCTNEENYVFQKFVRAAIGTNNVDHCARLCHASTVAGLATVLGSGAMTNPIDEFKNAKCILVTGSNTTETHPIISLEIKKAVKNGCKLIVVEPRNIDLCKIAHLSLKQKPGTDVAWINGMMNVIISENLHNQAFIDAHCENFDEVKALVAKYTPEKVQEITGIPANGLREAARIYATSETSSIVYSMGITQHTSGTENVKSIANLAMLCGQIGRESTGVNPLRGQNNVQGACDMAALPNVYPGYQQVADPAVKEKFEKAWGVPLDGNVGKPVTVMMEGALDGTIKGLYIMGENPMVTDPDLNHVEKALKNLEFLVVQDIFPTETALLADVILPAVSFAEKTGTITNTERRVQMVRQALVPEGQRKQDYEIVCELSKRLGYNMKYSSQEAIMKEIAKVTPSYGGISHKRIEQEGGLQWPCPNPKHPGTKFLHKDGNFTRGKGLFTAIDYRDPAELCDAEYPITLTTGRVLEHYHSGSMSRRAKPIHQHIPSCWVEISPSLADSLKVSDGEMVSVKSRRGKIDVAARVTDKVVGDVVFIPFHFAEAAANKLTNAALDPIAKIPEFKVCAVSISKA